MIEADLVDRVSPRAGDTTPAAWWNPLARRSRDRPRARGRNRADTEIVFAFGWLHEPAARRRPRPSAGPRAAMSARDLHEEGLLDLEDDQLAFLYHALEFHGTGNQASNRRPAYAGRRSVGLPRVRTRIPTRLSSTRRSSACGSELCTVFCTRLGGCSAHLDATQTAESALETHLTPLQRPVNRRVVGSSPTRGASKPH